MIHSKTLDSLKLKISCNYISISYDTEIDRKSKTIGISSPRLTENFCMLELHEHTDHVCDLAYNTVFGAL